MTPGTIIGALSGATLAGVISTKFLSIIFIVFTYCAATQLLFGIVPGSNYNFTHKIKMFIAGNLIGGISSLVAIGGGLLTVPFLSLCNVKLQHAIGTAAAMGLPIALAGTIGYVVNGMLQSQALPEYSLGYVYLPALGWMGIASILTASLGARTVHIMPTKMIKNIFVLLLYSLGTKMLIGIL